MTGVCGKDGCEATAEACRPSVPLPPLWCLSSITEAVPVFLCSVSMDNNRQALLGGIKGFEKSRLKHTVTKVKQFKPTAQGSPGMAEWFPR